MMKRKKIIQYGFMAYGIVMATGILFVFMPQDAMVRIGTLCRLPRFEVTPVFEYMARGLSFVAFLFGLLMLYFAANLSEQTRLIRIVGWTALASVPVAIFIHASAHTPLWWEAGDIVGLLALCILCLLSPKEKESEQPDSCD